MTLQLLDRLQRQVLIIDGAFGTEIFKKIKRPVHLPELLNIENQKVIREIHSSYIEAGADIIETNTLGANRIKLAEHNETRVLEINRAAVELALQARAGEDVLIAGSIGPVGKLIRPLGELSVDQVFKAFTEQAEILAGSGVDFLLIETHIDILEAKTAVLACKAVTSLPVAVSMTFPMDEGRTVTGTDPETAAAVLSATQAELIGINCGGHPRRIQAALDGIKRHTRKPILAYANAGEPIKEGDMVRFPLSPEEFLPFALSFYEQGASIIGGCCGTGPEHIRLIAGELKGKPPIKRDSFPSYFRAAGRNMLLTIGSDLPFRVVGENINPFARKSLNAAFKEDNLEPARIYARDQEKAGADALDINLGKRGNKEPEFYARGVEELQSTSRLPFFLDNSSPDSIEAALKLYAGKAVINSITGETKNHELLFPLAKKYGSAAILLALDEHGIPEKAADRVKIIERLIQTALDAGLASEDLIADPITLALSASQATSGETLKAIEECRSLGIPTIIGLSNISFGLPRRKLINSTYLTMAVTRGLDSAIMNPLDDDLMNAYRSAEAASGRDKGLRRYIDQFSGQKDPDQALSQSQKKTTPESALFQAVVEGEKSSVAGLIDRILAQGKSGFEILGEILTPALRQVGELYQKKIYFLPQLILSAETMEAASRHLEKSLPKEKKTKKGKKIILATVKGDLHDIGKNIVALVLRNFGYDVNDLGKNVGGELILETAVREKADFIGLSALMTTTLEEMEQIIRNKNLTAPEIKVIVGGAAVSPKYAVEIGADAHAKDALDGVKKLKQLETD